MKRNLLYILAAVTVSGFLVSCMGSSRAMMSGGEVTGSRASSFTEPTPYGMVEVKRGYLKVGLQKNDYLCGWFLDGPNGSDQLDVSTVRGVGTRFYHP